MAAEPILYSTSTWLAYKIAQRYYQATHYVWCTPFFDPKAGDRDRTVPPSSSPLDMYRALHAAYKHGDRHSSKVTENKIGILRGAAAKHGAGVITPNQRDEISYIVEEAQVSDFRPLLFVIPTVNVVASIVEPPPQDKAHPLSEEYIIPELPRAHFDVIEFGDC